VYARQLDGFAPLGGTDLGDNRDLADGVAAGDPHQSRRGGVTAIKWTPAGRTPRVSVTVHADADGVHLVVAARGIGIPDGEKARVFESFYRARPVDCGGTRFCVTLPAAVDAFEPDPIAALRTCGMGRRGLGTPDAPQRHGHAGAGGRAVKWSFIDG
jgi:hypothetical protein